MANNNTLDLKINIDTKLRGVLALIRALEKLGDAVNVRAEFEKLQTTLNSVSLSSYEAEKSFIWIKEFAKNTPVSLQDVTANFIKLKAYGIDPVNGTLKTLTDTSSAMGKDLGQAVEALADAVTGENERLKEFGIKRKAVGDDFKYTFTNKSGETKDIVVKNNKEMIESTLLAIFNEKYAGRAEAQSKTLQGINNNLKDNFEQLQVSLVKNLGIYDITKESLKGIADGVTSFNLTSEESLEISKKIIDTFTFLNKQLSSLTLAFNVTADSVKFLIDSYSNQLDLLFANIDVLATKSNESWLNVQNTITEQTAKITELRAKTNEFFGDTEEAEKLRLQNARKLKESEINYKLAVDATNDAINKKNEISEKVKNNQLKIVDKAKEEIAVDTENYGKKLQNIEKVNEKLKKQSELTNIYQTKIDEENKKQVENEKSKNDLKDKLLTKSITEIEYKKQLSELTKKEQSDYQSYINKQFERYNYKVSNNLITAEQQKTELNNLNILATKYDEIGKEKIKVIKKNNEEESKETKKKIEQEHKDNLDLIENKKKDNIQLQKDLNATKMDLLNDVEYAKEKLRLELLENDKFNEEISKMKIGKSKLTNAEILEAEKVLIENRKLLILNGEAEIENAKIKAEMDYQEKRKFLDREKKSLNNDLGLTPKSQDTNLMEILRPTSTNQYEDDLARLKEFQEEEYKLEEEHGRSLAELKDLQRQQERDKEDLQNKYKIQSALEIGNKMSGAITAFADIGLISSKKRARAQQAIQIAQATINTYTRATARLATGGPYLGPVLARVRVAQGLAQVAQIRAQKFHTGGYISADMTTSRGNLRNDEVQATLQTGEGVLSRRGMKELENLNQGKSDNLNNNSGSGEVNVVIVDNRQSREDYLKSRNGKKIIKEINNS